MRADHRPWPVPDKPWLMKQTWHELLFAHWPIDAKLIRPHIPEQLELDTYEGQAWIGVVPFRMSGIRLRYLPPLPFISKFAELNVRTYVTIDGKPGVYFFSLDAASYPAVQGAKLLFRLPYYHAKMVVRREGGAIHYDSARLRSTRSYTFAGTYHPTSPQYFAEPGTLEHWLTERYCLYTAHRNRLYRCDILHEPWALQKAKADLIENTMVDIEGYVLPDTPPLLHYAERLDVLIWGLDQV